MRTASFKITTVIVILSLIFFCSCKKNNKEIHFNELPINIKLKHNNELNSKNNIAIKPNYILNYDSLLIVNDLYGKAGDNYIYIFNKSNFKLMTSIGIRGKGPKELNSPALIALNKRNRSLWILDYSNQKIWKYDIDSIIEKENYTPNKFIELPKNYEFITSMAWIKDTLIVDGGYNSDLLAFIHQDSEKIVTKGKEHKQLGEIQNPEKTYTMMMWKHLSVSQEHKMIALAYQAYDRLMITDYNCNKLFTYIGPDHTKPEFKGYSPANTKVCYRGIQTSKNYIMGLYQGSITSEIRGKSRVQNYPNKIHIFNFDGEIIGQYILDREISNFYFDRDSDRIIALDAESDNTFIVYENVIGKLNRKKIQ